MGSGDEEQPCTSRVQSPARPNVPRAISPKLRPAPRRAPSGPRYKPKPAGPRQACRLQGRLVCIAHRAHEGLTAQGQPSVPARTLCLATRCHTLSHVVTHPLTQVLGDARHHGRRARARAAAHARRDEHQVRALAAQRTATGGARMSYLAGKPRMVQPLRVAPPRSPAPPPAASTNPGEPRAPQPSTPSHPLGGALLARAPLTHAWQRA